MPPAWPCSTSCAGRPWRPTARSAAPKQACKRRSDWPLPRCGESARNPLNRSATSRCRPMAETTQATALHELTAAQAARLIRERQISPVELIEQLLARANKLDEQVQAWVSLD